MAIINRTPDSFYDSGATFDLEPALVRLGEAVREGADLVDVGGVRAGYGPEVDAAEELRRTADFVAEARSRFPDLVISVDTWRSEVADELCQPRRRPRQRHLGGPRPRARRGRRAARRRAGVQPHRRHRAAHRPAPLRVRRRGRRRHRDRDVAGRAGSRRRRAPRRHPDRPDARLRQEHPPLPRADPHGSTSSSRPAGPCWSRCPTRTSSARRSTVDKDQRLPGTLAATAVSAWQGARVFRAHKVAETRQVLDMVASIRGDRPPAVACAVSPDRLAERDVASPLDAAIRDRSVTRPRRRASRRSARRTIATASSTSSVTCSMSRSCCADLAVGQHVVAQPVEQPAPVRRCRTARSGTT